ncbi:UbiD family decarboxylase [Streptomyces sp. NPDC090052]|uniref:UbiD family decarboxylase n=1 Tax=unclassified Streptomyces TaxID=2593676 RepID=UPI002255B909|nr:MULTISPECIES: UbiD family decarboxylase [unclassified Streptomyces]MCX4725636.1 UbiD family decarboxylase [Streptomyces sp. NBC_01306]WSV05008.1 UbiD family decarboxylase [Streptomyces sp. NBC_01020]
MTAIRDLRQYIDHLTDTLGEDEVRVVDGAHWDLEIGCITELLAEAEGPALLFDNIPGYPAGRRVLTNFMGTAARTAVALGLPPDSAKLDIVRAWQNISKRIEPVPPVEVATGPVLENVLEGDDVDLTVFPTPRWHDEDGGRYIGTACMVLARDPDTGWVNAGTYRCCVQDKDRLSVWMLGNRHAREIATKYWDRGLACPIAVVVGQDPILSTAAAMAAPAGVSEYDLAGGLRGEGVEVLYPPDSDIPVPAHAEIVIEGEMPPLSEESVLEGPFGEWTGYYTHSGQETVVRVKRILHRDDPIILGAPPMIPTVPAGDQAVPLYSASVTWDHLENSGVQNIQGVWAYARQLMIVVSIKQTGAGDAMHALLAAAGRKRTGGMERYFVVVDEDIDITDINHVLWAVFTRVDPANSLHLVRTPTTAIDPMLSPKQRAEGDLSMGIVLIDACKPFAWKDEFPAANRFSDAYRARTRERWATALGL